MIGQFRGPDDNSRRTTSESPFSFASIPLAHLAYKTAVIKLLSPEFTDAMLNQGLANYFTTYQARRIVEWRMLSGQWVEPLSLKH
jgi:hypothetical protein